MSPFKFKSKKSGPFALLLPLFLTSIIMYSVYVYADVIGDQLSKIGVPNILLALFSIFGIIIILMEGIYKAQGILFDTKDNNLVFSLPIKKSTILASRMVKLLIFEYIFELLFVIPAFVKYVQIVPNLGLYFYTISLIFLLLLPIIPTIVSCVLGFLVKFISSKYKKKNLVQTILMFSSFILIMLFSFNVNSFIDNITSMATSIDDVIKRIYLPIGLYSELLNGFDIKTFLLFLTINILPFIVFIYIFSLKFNSIINEHKESFSNKKRKAESIIRLSKRRSLIKKDLKKFFASPLYIFNTTFGLLLLIVLTILTVINFESTIETVIASESMIISAKEIVDMLPIMFICIILFVSSTYQVSASSISLEGKNIYSLKSLPIEPIEIFKSKLMMSNMLIIPVLIICSLAIIIRFKIFNFYALFMVAFSILFPILISSLGLLINLLYPKLEYNSEVEVIKQSASSMISTLSGIAIAVLSIVLIFSINTNVYINLSLLTIIYIVLILIVNKLLKTYGTKRFSEL